MKSHDHVIFDGETVAYAGDKLTSGAKILPQQSPVVGDSGVVKNISSIGSNLQLINSMQNLTHSLTANGYNMIFLLKDGHNNP